MIISVTSIQKKHLQHLTVISIDSRKGPAAVPEPLSALVRSRKRRMNLSERRPSDKPSNTLSPGKILANLW